MEKLMCLNCKEEKPLDEMCKHAGTKLGYEKLCKQCRSIRRYANGSYQRERLRKHKIRSGKPTYYTDQRIIELMNTSNCAYCGVEMNHNKEDKHQATIDHIFVGYNIDYNVVASCRGCNSSKGKRHVYDFYITSDKFTDELWMKFVTDFAGRMLRRKPTPNEILAFANGFKEEAEEIKKWEEKQSV